MNISRVGLIGDVHGQYRSLDTILRFLLGGPPLDAILCTGDLPAKGNYITSTSAKDTNICCRLLEDAGVITIRGNHDRFFVENAADPMLADLFRQEWTASAGALHYLQSLTPAWQFQTPLGPLLLCHGVGTDDMAGIYPGGEDTPIYEAFQAHGMIEAGIRILVAGHTHRRMCRTVGNIIVVNPGSLLPDKETAGFAVVDFNARSLHFHDITADGHLIAEASHWPLTLSTETK